MLIKLFTNLKSFLLLSVARFYLYLERGKIKLQIALNLYLSTLFTGAKVF